MRISFTLMNVNNTIYMYTRKKNNSILYICSCNQKYFVLLSKVKYSMVRISRNWDETVSFYHYFYAWPTTKHDVIYSLVIHKIYNNIRNTCVILKSNQNQLYWHTLVRIFEKEVTFSEPPYRNCEDQMRELEKAQEVTMHYLYTWVAPSRD